MWQKIAADFIRLVAMDLLIWGLKIIGVLQFGATAETKRVLYSYKAVAIDCMMSYNGFSTVLVYCVVVNCTSVLPSLGCVSERVPAGE